MRYIGGCVRTEAAADAGVFRVGREVGASSMVAVIGVPYIRTYDVSIRILDMQFVFGSLLTNAPSKI